MMTAWPRWNFSKPIGCKELHESGCRARGLGSVAFEARGSRGRRSGWRGPPAEGAISVTEIGRVAVRRWPGESCVVGNHNPPWKLPAVEDEVQVVIRAAVVAAAGRNAARCARGRDAGRAGQGGLVRPQHPPGGVVGRGPLQVGLRLVASIHHLVLDAHPARCSTAYVASRSSSLRAGVVKSLMIRLPSTRQPLRAQGVDPERVAARRPARTPRPLQRKLWLSDGAAARSPCIAP